MYNKNVGFAFIFLSLSSLLAALIFGLIGSFQYIMPGFLYELVSFEKARPLHVTLVVTWLFTASIGGIYYYMKMSRQGFILACIQFIIILITGIAILYSYFIGMFGGREYFEFPPFLAVPMGTSWLLFMLSYSTTAGFRLSQWKIYNWMWATGIVFFLITFIESYLWTLPFFNANIVRDITIQWKALGAFVGSWNMLIYGTAFYLMEKIGNDDKVSTSGKTYFFYFLGLTNLMFNWGHHTYNLPAAHWIRTTAYIISMTELLILGNIIYAWRSSYRNALNNKMNLSYRFLTASDVWIFLNLALAIIISIPAVNLYTHGTHITVAHAMGATIGINTMILFASIVFIAAKENSDYLMQYRRRITNGLLMLNVSLFVFWIALIAAGITRTIYINNGSEFYLMSKALKPYYMVFAAGGTGIAISLALILMPLIRVFSPLNFSTPATLIKKNV